jgi:mannosyltransferase
VTWLKWLKWSGVGFVIYCLPWLAGTPRFDRLDESSFWYDEVVSARIAREPSDRDAIHLLMRTDATCAPLYPLVLRHWFGIVGTGEGEARSLSAACGVVTCVVVLLIGWRLGGLSSGLWSAGFAGLSPLLVEYDREARMYAMLTMLSTLAWWNLLRFRDRSTLGRTTLQVVLTTALAYTHPLGLLMIAALAVGWAVDRRYTRLSARRWLAIQMLAAALIAPWSGNYMDHPPEFLTEDQSLKLLLGMPIGFTGGHSGTLALCVSVIGVGLLPMAVAGLSRRAPESRGPAWPIVAWLVVPPVLLFIYSRLAHPIFGPSRYNVYVAPAYVILLGVGLSRIKLVPALLIGLCLLLAFALPGTLAVMDEWRKADWKGAANLIQMRAPPGTPVILMSHREGETFELEVARYYLGATRQVVPYSEDERDILRGVADDPEFVVFVTPTRGGSPIRPIPRAIGRNRLRAGLLGFGLDIILFRRRAP